MPTITSKELNIAVTDHAKERIDQRGICEQALALLALHGFDSPAGSGCFRRELHHRQTSELHEQGYSITVIEKALRLEAIFSEDDELITCYKRSLRLAVGRTCRTRNVRRAVLSKRRGHR